MKDVDEISGDVLNVAVRHHQERGPGLLESVDETIMAAKLRAMGYDVARQGAVDREYDGMRFDGAFWIDLLVDERPIVENKSVERLTGDYAKPLPTHLRLTGQPLGLLINFAGETLKEGVRRIVNNLAPPRLRVNQATLLER